MKRQVYLDNAATTRVRPEVRDAVIPFLSGDHYGNPSSSHRPGRNVRAAVEEARRRIASAIGTAPTSIVFTSGGTEADNLAVIGGVSAATTEGKPPHVAVSAVEHKAVLDSAKAVERGGGKKTVVDVDRNGAVILEGVDAAISDGATLVSVMWVNNETGTVQDVPEVAARCRQAGVSFHTDAVQAIGKVPCSLVELPDAMLSISGHKIGAPKGIGALVLPAGQTVDPLIHGGGQQAGVRPGTENVIGIVALGVAVELAVAELTGTANRTDRMRCDLESRILAAIPDAQINGADGSRAPHISNISFPSTRSDALTMHLDLADVYCSTGSACNTGVATPSHVLSAMGVPDELATAAIRFSFSCDSDDEDVDRVMAVLPNIVKRLRDQHGGS
jgi:cysteine desulfurase